MAETPTRPTHLPAGCRVRRGPDWKWDVQDEQNGEGTVIGQAETAGWVKVRWDSGYTNNYRFGAENCFDLTVVEATTTAQSEAAAAAIAEAATETASLTTSAAAAGAQPLSGDTAQWFWRGNDGGWNAYPEEVCKRLEAAFQGKLGTAKADEERFVTFCSLQELRQNFHSLPDDFGLVVGIQRRFDDENKRRLVKRIACISRGPLTEANAARAAFEMASANAEEARGRADAALNTLGDMRAEEEATDKAAEEQEEAVRQAEEVLALQRRILEERRQAQQEIHGKVQGAEHLYSEESSASKRADDEKFRTHEVLTTLTPRESEMHRAMERRNPSTLTIRDVQDIALELGLGEYARNFVNEKIDGEVLVNLTDEQLKQLGLTQSAQRQRLRHAVSMIEACGQLHVTTSVLETVASSASDKEEREAVLLVTWDVARVSKWLEEQGIPREVREKLAAGGINGERLLHLNEDVCNELGIRELGNQIKLQRRVLAIKTKHFSTLRAFFDKRLISSSAPLSAPSPTSDTPTVPAADAEAAAAAAEKPEGEGEVEPGRIPKEFTCPITMEIMVNPVVAPDGFIYEEANIRRWLESHTTSPMTALEMPIGQLYPCNTLRSAILSWKERHPSC